MSTTKASSNICSNEGKVLWSVTLPKRGARSVSVDCDGNCFVTSGHSLIVVSPEGEVLWTIESERTVGPPAFLPSGDLMTSEKLLNEKQQSLVVRDRLSGELIQSLPIDIPGLYPPHGFSDGSILIVRYIPYCKQGAKKELQRVSTFGKTLWSTPLPERVGRRPLVTENLIAYGYGSYIRGCDLNGKLLWIANKDGFQFADDSNDQYLIEAKNDSSDRVSSEIFDLGDGKLLAALRWYSGSGFLIFDTSTYEVYPLPDLDTYRLMPIKPVDVVNVQDEQTYIVAVRRNALTMVNIEGELKWQADTPKGPRVILSDNCGNVVFSHSPDYERWTKYYLNFPELYPNLKEQCFIRAVDFEGKEIFTWQAPEPLSGVLAIGKEGEVYCVSDSKLWAIG